MRAATLSSLLLTVGLLSSCILEDPLKPPDRTITCSHFADFQRACTAHCSVTWSCESNYSSLDVQTQIALDDCSDCLADNLASGVCKDCSDTYEGSCQAFIEELLGVDCW